MRFFFNIVSEYECDHDEEGATFLHVEDAKSHAMLVASELAVDRNWDAYCVVVVDEYRNEIVRYPISPKKRH
jgi:hypothetical protein